jgi:hypothetical protein
MPYPFILFVIVFVLILVPTRQLPSFFATQKKKNPSGNAGTLHFTLIMIHRCKDRDIFTTLQIFLPKNIKARLQLPS